MSSLRFPSSTPAIGRSIIKQPMFPWSDSSSSSNLPRSNHSYSYSNSVILDYQLFDSQAFPFSIGPYFLPYYYFSSPGFPIFDHSPWPFMFPSPLTRQSEPHLLSSKMVLSAGTRLLLWPIVKESPPFAPRF